MTITKAPAYPTANGRRFDLDVSPDALKASRSENPDLPPYQDYQHTDRLDNFTVMEVAGKSRCHGMHLEGMAYPITPMGMHYLLIHYDVPNIDEKSYQLEVGGLVKNQLTLDMDKIRSLPKVTMPATMECCGNGRASQRWRLWAHVPWNHDAIGTAEWTGVPLHAVLEQAGVQDDAVEILFTGLDTGIQGPPDCAEVQHFQRSLTVDYAMNPDNDVLLCYEINGQPLPPQHGFPLRLLVPGWLGMANVKWLGSIEAIDWRLTKNQMKWYSYAEDDNYRNLTMATFQQVRAMMIPPGIPDFLCRIRHLEATDAVELRGRAWSGGRTIENVEVSVDGGDTWSQAKLDDKAVGKWAWVGWSFTWKNVTPGQYLLQCRATDSDGNVAKDDDFARDYYAMDNTMPHMVDVNVYPKGTLTVGNQIECKVQFPSL
ncbi:sulfite oxidase [Mycobacterium sp. SVM_VP21]|nr:sulfite oxidase [Mycobacterium sp. SVM_VP21]